MQEEKTTDNFGAMDHTTPESNEASRPSDKFTFNQKALVGTLFGAGGLVAFVSAKDKMFGTNEAPTSTSVSPDSGAESVLSTGNVSNHTASESTMENSHSLFSDAFAHQRHLQGPGGIFQHDGKLYNTFYKEEYEKMSAQEIDKYQHDVVEKMGPKLSKEIAQLQPKEEILNHKTESSDVMVKAVDTNNDGIKDTEITTERHHQDIVTTEHKTITIKPNESEIHNPKDINENPTIPTNPNIVPNSNPVATPNETPKGEYVPNDHPTDDHANFNMEGGKPAEVPTVEGEQVVQDKPAELPTLDVPPIKIDDKFVPAQDDNLGLLSDDTHHDKAVAVADIPEAHNTNDSDATTAHPIEHSSTPEVKIVEDHTHTNIDHEGGAGVVSHGAQVPEIEVVDDHGVPQIETHSDASEAASIPSLHAEDTHIDGAQHDTHHDVSIDANHASLGSYLDSVH